MKKLCGVLLIWLLVFTYGCAKEAQPTPPAAEQNAAQSPVKTATQEVKQIVSADFEDVQVCYGCHPNVYEEWQGTMHFSSDSDGFYNALFQVARKETNGGVDVFCASCHTPIGVISKEIPPAEGPQISAISKQGIQCDFCHTVSGSTGIGNGAYISSPGKIKQGPFKDVFSPYHETKYSELHTKSEFCGMCHDVSHPTNKLPLETSYAEWKESTYAKEGIQCQDCHMKAEAGKAANSGPVRDKIFTHTMVGGTTAFTDSAAVKDLAIKNLKNAAKVEIVTSSLTKGIENKLQVKVTNIGAGHYLPTGLTEARQMWLEVIVKNEKGDIIFQSGEVDAKGNIAENAVIFNTVIADNTGKPTLKFWNAEKIISSHRIPPKQSLTEDYSVKIPAAGKVICEARLRYRSAPQEEVDALLGNKTIMLPITDMAAASATLQVN